MQDYSQITNGIEINVIPVFLPEKSSHPNNLYTFAYNVRIDNRSNSDIQLLNRYWRIVDENGSVHEVKGEGVIGEKPIIKKGGHFIYTSGTYLKTPSGVMNGHYQMIDLDTKDVFDAQIPMFSLDSPFEMQKLI